MMSKQPAPVNTVNAGGAGNGMLNLLLPLLTGGQQDIAIRSSIHVQFINCTGVISSQSNLRYLVLVFNHYCKIS